MASTNVNIVGDTDIIKDGDPLYHQDPPMVVATPLPPESAFETVIIDDDLDPDYFVAQQETTPLLAVYTQTGRPRNERRGNYDTNETNAPDEDGGGGGGGDDADDEQGGEKIGPVFRDWFFAVLFYAQLMAVLYAGIVWSPQGYENIGKMMNYTFIREQIELQSEDMTPEDWQKFDQFVSQVSGYISVYFIRIFFWTILPGALFAFFFAHTTVMFVVPNCSTSLVRLSLLLPVPLVSAWIIYWIIAAPNVGTWIVTSLMGTAVVYYIRLVWPMIPFAAVNLKVATIGINANMGTHLWAFFSVHLSLIWMFFWLYATFGTMAYLDDQCSIMKSNSTGTNKSGDDWGDNKSGDEWGKWGDKSGDKEWESWDDPNNTRLLSGNGSTMQKADESDKDCGQGGIFFLLLLSCYWTSKVLMNSVEVTVAGVMATWCFDKEAARGCCSPAVASSVYRSATYSFGSICLGSLLQGVMQVLRKIIPDPRSRRHNNDASCCGLCFCIFECCGRVLEDVLDYFHQWSYVFIGIYGYGYIESGRRVLELFVSKGWTSIISERLVSYVTGCITFTVGIVTGLCMWAFTILVDSMHEDDSILPIVDADDSSPASTFYVYGVVPRHVSFVIGFVLGAVASSVMMSVVRGGVNTLIVCFADSPARLEEEHPQLTREIIHAWSGAFPEIIQRNSFHQPVSTADELVTEAPPGLVADHIRHEDFRHPS